MRIRSGLERFLSRPDISAQIATCREFARRSARQLRPSLVSRLENLEPRTLLSTAPFISEFMASNSTGIVDEDGNHSDWIEITNPGMAPVDLSGYFLTDTAGELTKWRIPDVPEAHIPAGGHLLIFASGKDRIAAGASLHTNFDLDAAGEYLALVNPDGVTIVSDYGPQYPQQIADVSYGIATSVQSTQLVTANGPVRVFVPNNGSLGTAWTAPGFDDSKWISGRGGVGFDLGSAPPQIPGFTVRMIDVFGGIGDINTATQIANGPLPAGYSLQSDTTKDYAVVNHGPGGSFGNDLILPNGAPDGDEYVLRATANIFIPAGTWTFDVDSDDGFRLTIPGVTFTNRTNENNPSGRSDTLTYSSPRGPAHTSGTITVGSSGLSTTLTLDFYENGGGDNVELSIASGTKTFDNSFVLLGDGVLPGWKVTTTSSTPPPDFTPLIGTNISTQMANRNASAFIRIPISEVVNAADFDALRLRIRYDDGFIAYLNGADPMDPTHILASRNAPSTVLYDSPATADQNDAQSLLAEDIDVALAPGVLTTGLDNILAIQGMNQSKTEEDFLIQVELFGLHTLESVPRYFKTPTPDGANNPSDIAEVVADTKFSHSHGFYDTPFTLTITTDTPGAQIHYTLDGSSPTASTGNVGGTVVTIPISATTVVRAAAYKPGAISTNIDTQTYIFTSDVIRQSPNGQAPPGWPASWSPNTTDYGMDPDVVNNPLYAGTIQNDLKTIPSFSIVMDYDDLFGPTGIYSNPGGDGRTWERPVSLELIYPEGVTPPAGDPNAEGFQIDAGIRIRGGFSRSTDNPKHAFRLFFRNEYGGPDGLSGGQGRLNYPLFGDEGASSFDKIDLRTFQNYSWSFQGDPNGIFLRDQLGRDMQLAMGQPGERGEYYHLYINGQYWGLFNTDERPSADYGETYLGGLAENYDVIKPAPDFGYRVYATDGDMVAWTDLWTQVKGDMSNNANYLRLQGKNPDGSRNPNYPVLLDVDNLIDYMLIIFYGGNLDAPLSNFLGNNAPNNFFAIRDRTGDQGFKFFIHDAEHTLLNVYEDRTGPYNTDNPDPAASLGVSNPQYIYQHLLANPEFRLRVADRMHKWFHNGGVLTPESVLAMFNERAQEIDRAVVGESARWGDAKRPTSPITRQDWLNAVSNVRNNYIPSRTNIVFNQLVADGLWPSVAPPVFSQFGGTISSDFALTITAQGAGTVYYTLDGTDPRSFGGTLAPSARAYSTPLRFGGTTTVKARLYNAGNWSALTEATFRNDLSAVTVSELMYNPPAPAPTSPYLAQDYEFIELQNSGTKKVDLTGSTFTDGITFTFAGGQAANKLDPGARIVLVRNLAAFQERYPGVAVGGVYTGSLDNAGERLRLVDPAGNTIFDFEYGDKWYKQTDGDGFSLTRSSVAAAPIGDESAWRSSWQWGGNPGAGDPGIDANSIVINEVLAHTDLPDGDWIELYNTTGNTIDISGWFLSDDPGNRTKYQIQPNTTIAPHGFLVFKQFQSFGVAGNPGVNTPFGISELGDEVTLTSVSDVPSANSPGGYRDDVDFGASDKEFTFGRYVKSTGGTDFVTMSSPTQGSANALPLVGPIVISEIMYRPSGNDVEFVELLNLTGTEQPLFDSQTPANPWKLADAIDFTFPAGAKLAPFSYGVVTFSMDPAAFRTKYNVPADVPIWAPSPLLPANTLPSSANLKLVRPGIPDLDGSVPYVTVDQVHYQDNPPWPTAPAGTGPSLSRLNPSGYGNDAGNWTSGPFGGSPGISYTPPAAPFIVAGGATSGTQLHLQWEDRSVGEEGFRIERSADGVNFVLAGNVVANSTSFDDAGLTPGKFYAYRVRAYNGAGSSNWSNLFWVSTLNTQSLSLIGITDSWRYNQANTDLGTAWRAKNYVDTGAGWDEKGALFYNESAALPAPKTTQLSLGPAGAHTPTFYFRKHFNLGVDPSAVTELILRTVIDDEAIVYLNGVKVYSIGLPDDAVVNFSTYGQSVGGRTVGDAVFETFTLPQQAIDALVQGENVLAVEVHQVNSTSSDVVFGAELQASIRSPLVSADILDVDPDPRPGAIPQIQIRFSEPVTGLDLQDLRLSRDGGPNLLTDAQTVLPTNDPLVWVLGDLAGLTALSGNYTLTLTAVGSDIKGTAPGSILGADAAEAFRVTGTSLTGTSAADHYILSLNGANVEIYLSNPPAAVPDYVLPTSALSSLSLNFGDGDDSLKIVGQLPMLPTIVGGAGKDTLNIDLGSYTLGDLGATYGFEGLALANTAGVNLTTNAPLASLSLSDLSHVKLLSDRGVLTVGSLTLSGQAALDLGDNDLVVTGGDLSAITGLLATARAGTPRWTGPGIGTTLATVDQGLAVGTVGSDVQVKFTWNGDLNLDGRVNADDYFYIDQGFLQKPTPTTYHDGDFNFDGKINADDYFLIDQAFLNQNGQVLSAPKPAMSATVTSAQTTRKKHVSRESVFSRRQVRRQPRGRRLA